MKLTDKIKRGLKKAVVYSLVTSFVLGNGCAGRYVLVNPEIKKKEKKEETTLEKKISTDPDFKYFKFRDNIIEFVEFNDYNIKPIKTELNVSNLHSLYIFLTQNTPQNIFEQTAYTIEQPKRFKEEVVKVAKELGYDLSNLSIKDAIEASSRITASRLEYDKGLVENSRAYLKLMERDYESIEDFDKAKENALSMLEFDELPEDQIFLRKNGICRHYADVNSAVFSVIKSMNPNLRNTYMTSVSHNWFAHRWNMVLSFVEEKDKKIRLIGTFVDPTWIDTEDDPALKGLKVDKLNAFDKNHFNLLGYADIYNQIGENEKSIELYERFLEKEKSEKILKISILKELAELYKELGQNYSGSGGFWGGDIDLSFLETKRNPELGKEYFKKAYKNYGEILNLIYEVIKEKDKDSKYNDMIFALSIIKDIGDLLYLNLQDYKRAIEEYSSVLRIGNDILGESSKLAIRYNIANSYYCLSSQEKKEKNLELALENYRKVAEVDTNFYGSESRLSIADILYNQKKFREAIDTYQNVNIFEEDEYKKKRLNFGLAQCYFQLNEFDESLAWLNKIKNEHFGIDQYILKGEIYYRKFGEKKSKDYFNGLLKTYKKGYYKEQILGKMKELGL